MKISSIARINFTLISLCVSAVLFASLTGILPDERKTKSENRARLSEALATNVAFLIANRDYDQLETQFEFFTERNTDARTVGLRHVDGKLLASAGNHEEDWGKGLSEQNDGCYVVPIRSGDADWGKLEIQFAPLYSGIGAFVNPQLLKLVALLVPLVGVANWFHLRRVLRYLDPTQVVPSRVRQTLDSFAEGVVLLDRDDQIVLANDAFAHQVRQPIDRLVGMHLAMLPWIAEESEDNALPWEKAKGLEKNLTGATVSIECEDKNHVDESGKTQAVSRRLIFTVNASLVLDEKEEFQGMMVVFTDVTPLERKRAELTGAINELNRSKEAISKQNEELRYLATRDPLTGCINRRTFFDQFSEFWVDSKENGTELCAMMVDIDFFKSINDTYGHSMGDEVLRQTGSLLNRMAAETDVVCRYGGEEFSVLMPGTSIEDAEAKAEAIRIELSKLQFDGFQITASLGVSSVKLNAADTQELLDQADKCLYVAKRNGRNQVVRFDTVPEDLVVDESKISRTKPEASTTENQHSIPYPAVAALLSALSYRDVQTGTHSSRVASYCALLAQRVMGPRDVYVVEMAGLLHDIGKIGVPDAILLKPGALTEQEWEVMARHDKIGVEIINKAFKNKTLTEIVKQHHARFDGATKHENDQPSGEIPIGARILSIADAFDAMVSDRPYRPGMPIENALKELKRCAGSQFDPELVEHFCDIILAGGVRNSSDSRGMSQDVVLTIGEQIERLVEATESGDKKTYAALASGLQKTAEQSHLVELANAARHAVEVAGEDVELSELVSETMELLAICSSIHGSVAHSAEHV